MPTEAPETQARFVITEDAPALERVAFVQGLFAELTDQLQRYLALVRELSTLQARILVVERNLQLTRDHLYSMFERTDEHLPADWREVLQQVRFVGARLGDACVGILREQGAMTLKEIVRELNFGQYRFRTGTPLREVNAALLRQPHARKRGEKWVFVSEAKVA